LARPLNLTSANICIGHDDNFIFIFSVFAGTFYYHVSSLENVHKAKLTQIKQLDGISESTCLLNLDWIINSEEENYFLDLHQNEIVKKDEKPNPICRYKEYFQHLLEKP